MSSVRSHASRSRPVPRVAFRGQALTEFLVAAVALVPLFLLIPLVAKYQDISHAVQMASRYVAFDAFVRNDSVGTWKPPSQLADEVRRRLFGTSTAPIKTNDVAGNFLADHNLFWRGPDRATLIRDFGGDVSVSFGPSQRATQAEGFTPSADGLPFAVVAPQLQLQARGIYTANVSVKLANLPSGLTFYKPFDAIDLSISRSTSVVFDPWPARSPEEIERKLLAAPGVFPAGALAKVSPAIESAVGVIEWPARLTGPKLGRLDFWRDVVPDDRLSARQEQP